jgi:hypothetical protein
MPAVIGRNTADAKRKRAKRAAETPEQREVRLESSSLMFNFNLIKMFNLFIFLLDYHRPITFDRTKSVGAASLL